VKKEPKPRKLLPPWLALATWVVGAFVMIIVVWAIVITLAVQNPMQPIETDAVSAAHQSE